MKATSIKLNLIHSYLTELKDGLFKPRSRTQEVAIESMENYRGYVNFAAIRRSVRLRKLLVGKKRLRVRPPQDRDKVEMNISLPKIHELYIKKFARLAKKHNVKIMNISRKTALSTFELSSVEQTISDTKVNDKRRR